MGETNASSTISSGPARLCVNTMGTRGESNSWRTQRAPAAGRGVSLMSSTFANTPFFHTSVFTGSAGMQIMVRQSQG